MYRSISNSLSKISKSLNTKNSYQYINTGILSYFVTSPHEQTISLNILERKSEDCLEFLCDFNCIIKDTICQEFNKSSIPTQISPEDIPIPMLFRINQLKPDFSGLSLPIDIVNIKLLKMRIIDFADRVKLDDKRIHSLLDIWKKDK